MAEHVNELLREHVLRTGFNLVLTKTQIAALVELDALIAREAFHSFDELSPTWRQFHQNWISGIHGLERRGLVEHTFHQHKADYDPPMTMPVSLAWKITEAGRLTIALLKEAGIYQHYAGAMPAAVTAGAS